MSFAETLQHDLHKKNHGADMQKTSISTKLPQQLYG
jgi:hypothetical protein